MPAVPSGYIESSSSRFYKSRPAPGDIRLKAKYTNVGSAHRQNHHSDNQRKGSPRHRKLTAAQRALLPVQPVMVKVVDMKANSTRMMTAEQFAALPWGWKV